MSDTPTPTPTHAPEPSAAAPAQPMDGAPADLTRWVWLAAALLLAIHATLAISSLRQKNQTVDEIAHVTGGASYWLFHDYRLQPENGILPQRLVGLPLALGDYTFPEREGDFNWFTSDVWRLGHRYLYASGNDADEMVFRSRLPIVGVSVLLGLGVFWWSRRLWGPWGGLISLTLYAFSPTLLAHARLATSDVVFAATALAALGLTWTMMRRLTWLTFALATAVMGLAAVSKTSAVLLGPVALLMLAVRLAAPEPVSVSLRPLATRDLPSRWARAGTLLAALIAQGIGVVVIIWAFYGFRFNAFHHALGEWQTFYRTWDSLGDFGFARRVLEFARDYRLLPEAFTYGSAHAISHAQARQAFLVGQYSIDGWWWFFPFAMLIKTPIPTMLLVLGGLLAFWKLPERRRLLIAVAPLVLFIAVYAGVALTTNLNIGHRHVLPLYPPLFILAGALGHAAIVRFRAVAAVAVAVLVTLAGETLLIWPHYLAYFNPLLGGPEQGYRYLVDSSLDWGQDLRNLERYLDTQGLQDQADVPVYLSYFGTASPSYYGVQARRLPTEYPYDGVPLDLDPLQPGVYCISATMLQNLYVPTFGQWCERWENGYQTRARDYVAYLRAQQDPEAWAKLQAEADPDSIKNALTEFRQLEFGRLTRHLLLREPDARIGYSILVYHVSRDELRAALLGPPAELYPTPMIKGHPEASEAPPSERPGTGDADATPGDPEAPTLQPSAQSPSAP